MDYYLLPILAIDVDKANPLRDELSVPTHDAYRKRKKYAVQTNTLAGCSN